MAASTAGNLKIESSKVKVMELAGESDVVTLEINLEKKFFYEGEEVKGTVEVKLREPIMIEELSLRLSGECTVHWSKFEPTSPAAADAHEVLLDATVSLLKRGSCEEFRPKEIGRHEFFFAVALPPCLPSSFEAGRGGIGYLVTATLERPWLPTIQISRELKVRSIVDLSKLPQAMKPVEATIEQRIGFNCFSFGRITAFWRLAQMGYVAGDTIQLDCVVRNQSHVRIRKIKVALLQHLRYYNYANERFCHEKNVLLRVVRGEVRAGDWLSWNEAMAIAELPPTGLRGCRSADLWYTLKMRVYACRLSRRLECSTDVIIASVKPGERRSPPTPPSEPSPEVSAIIKDLSCFL